MSYVKLSDKRKLWLALTVIVFSLLMWGYTMNVSADTTDGGDESKQEETTKKDLSDKELFIISEVEDQLYTGEAICPEITITEKLTSTEETTPDNPGTPGEDSSAATPKEGESGETPSESTIKTLVKDTDYKVTYSNNINVPADEKQPQPTITVEGMGDYTGKVELTFTIKPVDVNDLELKPIDKTYKGTVIQADVKLYFKGKLLTRKTDYLVKSYTNNLNVGTATGTVYGIGNFTGTRKVEFKINPKNMYSLDFSSISVKTYTGAAITPKVTIIDKEVTPNRTLEQNKDYILSYIDNVRVGTAGVLISGTGNYSGSKIITFTIRPTATNLVKLTKGKKKIKVTWTKKTAQVTGYEIQYATNSKFSGAKKVKVNKAYSTKTLIKLKGKKKYYVRIRTYKSVAGLKYYSKWSNVKSITTKK